MGFEAPMSKISVQLEGDEPEIAVRRTIPHLLVPTDLPTKTERPKIVDNSRKPSRFPLLLIITVFGGFWLRNLGRKILGRYDAQKSAVRLREVFENLGGLWIKVGQLLAMRNDIFSDEVCAELTKLQSRAVGFPFEKVRQSVEMDLGKPLEDAFSSFEQTPFAAASISQIHKATIHGKDGIVCVKVLRPDAEQAFLRDLAGIKRFFAILGWFKVGKHLHLDEALYELEQMVTEELDFRYEASNTRRMRKTLKEHAIYVPKVYRKHSGQHTLVTEFADGILMSDVIALGHQNPAALKQWCVQNNIKPKKVARRLFYSAMRQLFEDNLFHADIHPGNILLLKDSNIVLLDFGTIGQSTKGFLSTYKASLGALAERDFPKAVDMTLQLTISPPRIDKVKQLRVDLIRSYREWDAVSQLESIDYHDRSLASAGSASGKIMSKYGVQLSWDFMRISRTWATLDASISHLCPNANYLDMFRKYFADAAKRRNKIKTLVPRTVGAVISLTRSLSEYENLLGPALRSRMIYFATAGQMSQRFALSIIAFLSIVKWAIYIAVFGVALTLFDGYVVDVVEGKFSDNLFELFDGMGPTGFAIFSILTLVVVVFMRKAINRLNILD